jgi:hypothetical protein
MGKSLKSILKITNNIKYFRTVIVAKTAGEWKK